MRRLFILLCAAFLLVNGLPKGKKKLAKDEDEENEIEESSGNDVSSGGKANRLEKIGFQQEEASNEDEPTERPTSRQTQAQAPVQQYSYNPNNTAAYPASYYQQPSVNATQYASYTNQQPSAYASYYNTNTTQTNWPASQATAQLANSTLGQQTYYSNANVSKVSNSSTEIVQDVKPVKGSKTSKTRAAELKCFNKFGKSMKEGQTAPELVKIYEELHDCLQGKCNYKKAEKSLKKSLKEKTLPGQEVFHKYKCYFNWYELIKKACKPTRKEGEEEIEEEEESTKTKVN